VWDKEKELKFAQDIEAEEKKKPNMSALQQKTPDRPCLIFQNCTSVRLNAYVIVARRRK
jgi:hypothetical protein